MIASLGGAVVAKDGSRSYAGSGGMIGGLSFPFANWSRFTGAGAEYNSFSYSNAIPSPNPNFPETPNPNVPNIPQELPPNNPTNIPTTNPNTNPPVTPKGETQVNCVWDCNGQLPSIPLLPSSITDLLKASPRTSVEKPANLYSFVPNLTNGGSNMNNIIFIAIAAVAGYFIWKKYGKG